MVHPQDRLPGVEMRYRHAVSCIMSKRLYELANCNFHSKTQYPCPRYDVGTVDASGLRQCGRRREKSKPQMKAFMDSLA